MRPGQAYTVEGGISYGITKTLDVGAIGYYQQKVTSDSDKSAADRDRVAGVGPEISAFFPSITLGVSIALRLRVPRRGQASGPHGHADDHQAVLALGSLSI